MVVKNTTIDTRIIQGITMILCLCINTLGATTTIFSHTISNISSMYPTPLTPAPFTFSIWILIFLQWVYDFIWKNKSLRPIEYILNASWVIFFCNDYIITSYCILLLMTFRMILLYKGYITYTTWLCIASGIQGYIVGGSVIFCFTILAIILTSLIIDSPGKTKQIINTEYWKSKQYIFALLPSLTSLGVIIWTLIGILAK